MARTLAIDTAEIWIEQTSSSTWGAFCTGDREACKHFGAERDSQLHARMDGAAHNKKTHNRQARTIISE